ncbi:MAG TPA: 50S ribosomal protein L25/general stress protein Ctc [Rhodanobacteraceae bacterium]|nr:50S ribosomal protein L25/general stress protein Ctc [Rhodanobacteraceae bacterium]
MAQTHELAAQARNDQGKGASRRLRRAGQVPAIVYGAGEPPQNIQFEHNTLALAARNEWFSSSVLDLLIDGKRQKVLLRDVQKHPFKPQLLHLDFLRINENQAIRVRVPLHFLNQEKSPAGKASGVVVSHNITEVEISCLPKDLPEYLEIDLIDLKLGDIVHLSDIKLPAGVEIPELKFGKEHDHPVVTAQEIREEVEEAPEAVEGAAPAEGAAAPAAAPAEPAAAKKEEK